MTNYRQLVEPRKWVQDGAGWCLRYAQSFFGAPVNHPSAWAAWNATKIKHGPSVPIPGGVAVLLWFSHYGTYGNPPTYGNWGHVAIHVSGDAIYTSPGSGWGSERWGTIAQIEQRFNCKYVGWSEDINGLRVVEPVAVDPLPNQRVTGSNPVKRRSDATTASAELQPPLNANTIANFDGWKYGEAVNDGIRNTNIWYRGTPSGNWFWSGGFTSQSVAGLTDLNDKTPALKPHQRKAVELGANIRASANTAAAVVGSVAGNSVIEPEGWVTGENFSGNNIWYKTGKGYAWAGAFTVKDASGLKDLTPVPQPEPDPEPIPDPTPAPDPKPLPPTERPSVADTTPDWDKSAPPGDTIFPVHPLSGKDIELPPYIDEVREEVSPTGFNTGREGEVNHIVLHHAASPHYSGVVNTLNGKGGAPTANYVVKDNTIGKMVEEWDTPWTNTRWTSNTRSVTLEICNDQTTSDKPSEASHEAAAWVVARSAVRHGIELPLEKGINVFGHKDVSKLATSCPGELDVNWIVARANEILAEGVIEDVDPNLSDIQAQLARIEAATNRIEDRLNRIFKDN